MHRPTDSQAGQGRAGEHLTGWGSVSWRKGVLEGGSDPLASRFLIQSSIIWGLWIDLSHGTPGGKMQLSMPN